MFSAKKRGKHPCEAAARVCVLCRMSLPQGAEHEAAAEGTDIQIVVFPTKYPSGGEKQLIEILTGKQVPSGGLPSDVGIVCQNIGTTVAIRDAVLEGKRRLARQTRARRDFAAGDPLAQLQRQPSRLQRFERGIHLGRPVHQTIDCLIGQLVV